MDQPVKAADLPVGARVTDKDGRAFLRDRLGAQGWWHYPVGFYMDHEIDGLLRDGASITMPEESNG